MDEKLVVAVRGLLSSPRGQVLFGMLAQAARSADHVVRDSKALWAVCALERADGVRIVDPESAVLTADAVQAINWVDAEIDAQFLQNVE